MKIKINKVTLKLLQMNIWDAVVDAIVYPTEPMLTLSDALQALGGEAVQKSASDIGWCDVGNAVMGDGGNLKTKRIIYTVPPKWGENSARGKLENTVWATLELAEKHQCRVIATPPIGTGVMGYPIENCAKVMVEQIIDYSYEMLKHLREVHIYLNSAETYRVFEQEVMLQTNNLKDDGQVHTT